jgi:hypothetical protein
MARIVDDDVVEKSNKPNFVREQIESVRHLIRAVGRGDKLMQLICSEPGLGKTWIVGQELKNLGIKVEPLAPDNVAAFTKALYDHRDSQVLLLDDFDALARSERVAGIAKMAWGPTRTVVRHTVEARQNAAREEAGDEKFDPSIPPGDFKIQCRLIWLSNLNYEDPATVIKSKMVPHFQALCSRGLDPVWIDTSDEEDLFRYVTWLGTEGNMLNNMQMKKEIAEKAIAWFIVNRNRLTEISPRRLVQAAEYFQQRLGNAEPYMLGRLLSAKAERNLFPGGMAIPKIIGAGKWTS